MTPVDRVTRPDPSGESVPEGSLQEDDLKCPRDEGRRGNGASRPPREPDRSLAFCGCTLLAHRGALAPVSPKSEPLCVVGREGRPTGTDLPGWGQRRGLEQGC